MKEKIVDILPPKEKKPFFAEKKDFVGIKKRRFGFLWIILFIFLLLLGTFKLSKATIRIFPLVEEKNFQAEVLAGEKIPAKVFEISKNFEEVFQSTGKSLKAAEGVIKLYNNFTVEEEVWRKGTRFISEDGKVFVSKDKIVVPGAKIVNGKMVPSTVDVPVIAAEKGPEGNIGPSKFSILAYKGTPRYDKYWGESLEPMKGGGEVKVVTKNDLEEASKMLDEKIKERVSEVLKEQIPSNYLFTQDTLKIELLEKTPKNKEGDEVENFSFQVKTKISVLAFPKDEMRNFVFSFLKENIPKDNQFLEDKVSFDFQINDIDWQKGTGKILFKIKAPIFPNIDKERLAEKIKGKSTKKTSEIILKESPKIIKAKISLTPFWMPILPTDSKRIEILYPSF